MSLYETLKFEDAVIVAVLWDCVYTISISLYNGTL